MGLWLQALKLSSEVTRHRGFWGKQLVRGPVFLLSSTSTLVSLPHVPTPYVTEALPNQHSTVRHESKMWDIQKRKKKKKTLLPDMLDYFRRGYGLRTQASQSAHCHSTACLLWGGKQKVQSVKDTMSSLSGWCLSSFTKSGV